MAERRHERELFEGKDRRVAERRKGDRRKSSRMAKMLKYALIAVLTAVVLEVLRR